jgi:hypothetical protein
LRLSQAVYEVFKSSSGKLADEKGSDEQGKAAQLPPDAQQIPEGDNDGDGYVDCQKPLSRKPANPRSPKTERNIDNKNQECTAPQRLQMPEH